MYQDRLTLFIDILGFRSLIDSIGLDGHKVSDLNQLLTSLTTESLGLQMGLTINEELVPENELEQVRKDAKVFAEIIKSEYPLEITHFSDSVVMSAQTSNFVSCLNILDLTARLFVSIWEKYGLLLRGGLSIGKLVHVENGPLFGPAMIKSYDLESKLSIFPRVIIEKECYTFLESLPTFNTMSYAIGSSDNDEKFIDLSTAFYFIVFNSLHSAHPHIQDTRLKLLYKTSNRLQEIIDATSDEKVKAKYEWTKKNIENLIARQQ